MENEFFTLGKHRISIRVILWICGIITVFSIFTPIIFPEISFLNDFASNYLSTVLGAVLGVPIGIWVSKQERTSAQIEEDRKLRETRKKEANGVLRLLAADIKKNLDVLDDLTSESDDMLGIKFNSKNLNFEFWESVSISGLLFKLDNGDLIEKISSIFGKLKLLDQMVDQYPNMVLNFKKKQINEGNTSKSKTDILKSAILIRREIIKEYKNISEYLI